MHQTQASRRSDARDRIGDGAAAITARPLNAAVRPERNSRPSRPLSGPASPERRLPRSVSTTASPGNPGVSASGSRPLLQIVLTALSNRSAGARLAWRCGSQRRSRRAESGRSYCPGNQSSGRPFAVGGSSGPLVFRANEHVVGRTNVIDAVKRRGHRTSTNCRSRRSGGFVRTARAAEVTMSVDLRPGCR